MAPNMSDGLQIAQPETYPEAVNRYSPNSDAKLPQLHDHDSDYEPADLTRTRTRSTQHHLSFNPPSHSDQSEYNGTLEIPAEMWRKVFAHRRRNFWILCSLSIVMVGALVGGSIGGALFVQDKANKAAATASSTVLVTPTSAASASPTGSGQDNDAYMARPFGAVQSINTTCPSTLLISSQLEGKTSDISGRYTYSCLDSTNILDLNLMSFTAYTLEQCVDACSQYNVIENGMNTTCKAAVVNSDFRKNYESGIGANCWLKGGAGNASTGKTGYTAAVLKE
ncbi:hypothetical protein P3342_007815 [Pyrenophora teres f. teres]|uniref:Apple domain-containing protein n=1 Tax=Pyrenophora teres f. teres TaxID=97479 RepID=A0A6S6W2D7_9PLEO|nr:hypothetical protein HRS9122_09662 [Pyrenophora teres f. teres]KAE8839285.1 hypothetical protein HRS9139_03668 [Pyrenophora teres f. teres]KAE8845249.1 hypothetical protein PTNB85_03514 [Pyrenophora teres f. teres]KAE8865604.1 hypothetical protein PTNB29_02751 [Pyrenophora teres f. teres]KAE8871239.1 hypothetical protein PTNB73_02698 [Pyrenophora teres f. teres]